MTDSDEKRGGWIWSLVKFAATAGVWALIAGISVAGWYATDLPNIDQALQANRRPTVTLLAADGSVLATRGDLYGVPLQVGDLPKPLLQAVLATEDRRFYDHFGLDIIGIARAAYQNVRAGRIVQGGSTLTQQVAKNLFLTPERSYKRKIQEVLLSLWLEHKFTKDQIFTIYLNRVYLGAGTYGVDAAARRYFGVSATEITVYEAAMIAGLLKAPSRYNPLANLGLAKKRTAQVLKNMVSAGYLTPLEVAQSAARRYSHRSGTTQSGRYFIDWALEQVVDYLAAGDRDIKVFTTLNPALQIAAERRMASILDGPGKRAKATQAALVALSSDGAVRALVGGRNYAKSAFNRATQARRQPGSAFKPIVFLAALEIGMQPTDTVQDAPITIGDWAPRNFKRKFLGNVTIAKALAQSLNAAAVRLGQRAGFLRVAETASRLGIPGEIAATPSLVLGTHDVSLIDLTAAYAPFANGGMAAWPYAVREIRDADGKLLYARSGSGPGRVVAAQHVAQMNRMLVGVIDSGTGNTARLNRPAAGKTGTSQNHRDAWFIGYTADLIAGVWIGNDNGNPMKRVTGGGLPAILWKRFMTDAHRGQSKKALLGADDWAAIQSRPASTKALENRSLWNRILSIVKGED